MTPTNHMSGTPRGISPIITILFVALLFWGTYEILSSMNSTPAVAQPETHSNIEAYTDAEQIVTKALKAPSTAKFPHPSAAVIKDLGNDEFGVSAYVDSENSYGAMLRSTWTVVFKYVGDRTITYLITVNGETVYSRPST